MKEEGMELSYNLLLVGFMGTGKSTIAKALGQRLHVEVVDADNQIELKEKMTIPHIFERYGEVYFRDCETRYLEQVKDKTPMIISCGGGIVLRDENVSLMKEQGKVILLTATGETVLARVKDSTQRPILNGHMDVGYIEQLMEKRKDRYLQVADVVVKTDDKTVFDICEEIIRKISLL